MIQNYSISLNSSSPFLKIPTLTSVKTNKSERSELSLPPAPAEGLFIGEADIARKASVALRFGRALTREQYEAVLRIGSGPEIYSPLEGKRGEAERGPRSGESEGRSPLVLSVLEQVAKTSQKVASTTGAFPEGKHQNSDPKSTRKRKGASIKACQEGSWSMAYTEKESPNDIRFSSFCCKSWRCQRCSVKVRNRDYIRIQKSIQESPGQYLFAVLTFNPKKISKQKAYANITPSMNALIKKIERSYGQIEGMVAIEQHQSGYPHINLLFKFKDGSLLDDEAVEKIRTRFLIPEAVKRGFGRMLSLEIVKSQDKMASYMAKTGLTVISGEVSKVSQVPTEAPYGTRRLRSLRRWLKPLDKSDGKYTGGIVKASLADIEVASNKIGHADFIELAIRGFPQFEGATSISIMSTAIEKRTNFFRYSSGPPHEKFDKAC